MPVTLNRASQIKDVAAGDPRVTKVQQAIKTYQRRPDALIQILHTAQDLYGYLPLNIIKYVAKELKLPPSKVYGVVTFYHFFSLKPKGEHQVVVCTGTACFVKGAQKILDELSRGFSIKIGQTTADGKISVDQARCIGACGLAPAVILDNDVLAKVDATKIIEQVKSKLGAA
jgi:bidirectional [NiFe] hydrogenase diaphorase subunit